MYFSIFVTLISLVAFFWLGGLLKLRGSDGQLKIFVGFECDNNVSNVGLKFAEAIVDLKHEPATVRYYGQGEINDSCSSIITGPFPAPIQITDSNGDRITTRRKVYLQENSRTLTVQDTFPVTPNFEMSFETKSILEYTGISERNISIEGLTDCRLTIAPPIGFEIVESSIPGKVILPGWVPGNSPGAEWEVQMPKGNMLFRLKMRNEKLSRLDHILDSSVAALLGVGVGGIINSYLALILLRRSHRQHSP